MICIYFSSEMVSIFVSEDFETVEETKGTIFDYQLSSAAALWCYYFLHIFMCFCRNGPYPSFCLKTRFVWWIDKSTNNFAAISHVILISKI